MIKSIGIIQAQDGVSEYKDALINVYMNSGSKFTSTIGVAQVGKIVNQGESESFLPVAQVGTYEYTEPNPSFEAVQLVVIEGLKKDYPSVSFEIIK